MDTIKSLCTEQNQTDYRNFDTGITNHICHAESIVLKMVDISMVLQTLGQLRSISYPR